MLLQNQPTSAGGRTGECGARGLTALEPGPSLHAERVRRRYKQQWLLKVWMQAGPGYSLIGGGGPEPLSSSCKWGT